MARVFPFRALRYDPTKASPAAVLTQPYDKITPEMQERYYGLSPYNLVRIELGRSQADDDERDNVYTRAAACFHEWRQQGVLVQDPEPSFYVYGQRFRAPGSDVELERRGVIVAGALEEYGKGVVFRHEQTHAAPKADRLNLLRATGAYFGQLFLLYSDPQREVESVLEPRKEPEVEFRDEYGVEHRLWRIADPDVIGCVQRRLADKPLIIADGHHRYETALRYRDERRAANPAAGLDAPFERTMMTLVNMDAPGLVILATHRVIHGLERFHTEDLLRGARTWFDVHGVSQGLVDPSRAMALLAEAGREGTAMLAATSQGTFLLRARDEAVAGTLKEFPVRQRALDVVQLHKLLIERVLGISEEQVRALEHVRYLRDAEAALAEVRRGGNVAFLMNPVGMEQVRDIALAGEVLPQKSTDFYPKLLSGLTIYAVE
ncbi:MAG TPA: DUF1015 domain-containing protein [Terriglobales bacterium]|nr:DUF1015 domain-containing protein [Terriglobales bacterium]